jgi:hypothetical protein
MSRQFPVVNTASDTFANWITKDNNIINLVNTDVVTTSSNSAGDLTVGNGFVIGIFGSNTVVATDIRGGNVTASNVLLLSSNVNFTGSQANIATNVAISGANLYVTSTSSKFIGNAVFQSNATQAVVSITTNATNYALAVNVNSGFTVTGNATFNNRVDVTGNAYFANTISVTGGASFSNTIEVIGAANLQSSANVGGALGVVAGATIGGVLNLTGAATLSNTISVAGNATFSNTMNVVGVATFVNTTATFANVANLYATAINIGSGAVTGNSTGLYGVYYSGTINSTSNGYFANSTVITVGNTSINTAITPSSITANSGTFYNLNVTGSLIGTFSATGNFIPSPNNSLLIGTSANVFSHIYATNTYTNAISSYSGNLSIVSSVSLNGALMINSNNVITSGRYGFSSSSQAAIDAFAVATYRSGEYLIQMSETGTTNYHVTKLVVYHDDTSAYSSEFAQLFNNISLGTVTTDVSGGNVRVLVAPASANVVVKYSRNLITV